MIRRNSQFRSSIVGRRKEVAWSNSNIIAVVETRGGLVADSMSNGGDGPYGLIWPALVKRGTRAPREVAAYG